MKTKKIILLAIVGLSLVISNAYGQQASFNYGTRTGNLGTTYSWINCSGGTTITSGDDVTGSFNWPFNFTYYDNSYTTSNQISVSTNGFLRFDGVASTNYTAASSYNLTSTATNFGQIISVGIYDGKVGDNGGYLKYLVTGSAPNRILTIEYFNYEVAYSDNKYTSVQVSFYETTNTIVLKLGADNITRDGVDMGLHSGKTGYFNKWQEIRSGTNNTWIEYTRNKWKGTVSDDWNNAANWMSNQIPASGETIIFDDAPVNNLKLDQNRSVNNIVNNQGTYHVVTNGYTLSVSGELQFTNGAQIDATSSSSTLVFNGTSAQTIPSGAIKNNNIARLTINNASGLTLNESYTIDQSLVLTAGILTIGANTLTLNGTVSRTTGTLLGGSSTNIVYNGSGSTILPAVTLNNLTINRSGDIVSMDGNASVVGTLALTAGTLTTGSNVLTISGNSPTGTGNVNASATNGGMIFSNSSAITLASTFFGAAVYNLSINGAGGITSNGDFTVNGTLSLSAANPSPTKGCLDMVDGTTLKTLTMGSSASTIGNGDVTGKVKRNSLAANIIYTFGSQFSTLTLTGGTGAELPDEITFIIKIGTTHACKSEAVQRYYEVIRSGSNPGNTSTRFNLKLRYLDSELNSLDEDNLVFWDHHVTYSGTSPHAHGQSGQSLTDNYLTLASHGIGYLVLNEYDPSQEGTAAASYSKIWIIAERTVPAGIFVWTGTDTDHTNWTVGNNWADNVAPPSGTPSNDIIYIPDAEYYPTLPATTTVNTIYIFDQGILNLNPGDIFKANYVKIFNGGILNAADATIELYGAINVNNGDVSWNNLGTFNKGTSKVIFKNADAAISGTTEFYDIEIPATYKLTMVEGANVKIANSFSNSGTFNTNYFGPSIVEYNKNDDQTVVNPENNEYSTLILSGSGTKTLPASLTSIKGDFKLDGSTDVTGSNSLTIYGDFIINSSAVFNTGLFDHQLKSDFENNSTFTANSGYSILFNGSLVQEIKGSQPISFTDLAINNGLGVNMLNDVSFNGELDLIQGNLKTLNKTLGINGTVNIASFIETSSGSSLTFGGSSAFTISDNLFASDPIINNLTINQATGVVAGIQSFTINGNLNLEAGSFNINGKSLSVNGGITRNSGLIVSNNLTELVFGANATSLTVPDNVFDNPALGKLTINRSGAVNIGNQSITIDDKLILTDGLLTTNASGFIILGESASVGTAHDNNIAGSYQSYVNGKLRKYGNTAFTFPIGADGEYAPAAISAADGGGVTTDYFDAFYIHSSPQDDNFFVNSKGTGINHVSTSEYWMINRNVSGTNNVYVTLSWDSRSNGIDSTQFLIVTRWNGTQWVSLGQSGLYTEDLITGTITSLLVTEFSPFTMASSTKNNPLPVELVSFTSICNNGIVYINWETASEKNNSHFIIEKSTDAKNWVVLKTVQGSGNSLSNVSYTLSDRISMLTYYRLTQVDFDGTSETFKIIHSDACSENNTDISIFPNPAGDFVIINTNQNGLTYWFDLFDSAGRNVLSINTIDNCRIPISAIEPGIYYYNLLVGDKVVSGKLHKQ